LTKAEREERRAVLEQLRRDAEVLAGHFRLQLQSVEPESAQVKRRYGVCYSDGNIRIRMRHARTGRLLKYSGLIDTLCHELAHLRYFNHGLRFQALYRGILAHARRVGVYKPDPRRHGAAPPKRPALPPVTRRAPRPVQLELFSSFES
jgi:predicted metal-dependent hydrolase